MKQIYSVDSYGGDDDDCGDSDDDNDNVDDVRFYRYGNELSMPTRP